MIDRTRALPIKRQAELLGLARSTVYYLPEPVADNDLRLMRRMDELHLESHLPAAGGCGTCCVSKASRSVVVGSGG